MRDLDIRIRLRDFLKDKFSVGDPNCVVRDEFGVCQGSARIDIAVINGYLHGYEIKSEEDTLRRLPTQLDVYLKIFDYLTFVTNDRHLAALREQLPVSCGLMVARYTSTGEVELHHVRKAKLNKKIDPHSLVQLLWRDETLQILRQLGITQGMLSKPKRVLWDALASNLSTTELSERVRVTIKSRAQQVGSELSQGDERLQLSAK